MSTSPKPMTITEALAIAEEFDRQRNCGWNFAERICSLAREGEEFCATDFPQTASMGAQCHGTVLELALLHTLRPCKTCGSDHVFAGQYQVACCSCFGEDGGCENCHHEDGNVCAENMNLPDAITRWTLRHANDCPRGLVTVIH